MYTVCAGLLAVYYKLKIIYDWDSTSIIEHAKYPAYCILVFLSTLIYSEILYRILFKMYQPSFSFRRLIYLQCFCILASIGFIVGIIKFLF